jgi:hypothetical protein
MEAALRAQPDPVGAAVLVPSFPPIHLANPLGTGGGRVLAAVGRTCPRRPAAPQILR